MKKDAQKLGYAAMSARYGVPIQVGARVTLEGRSGRIVAKERGTLGVLVRFYGLKHCVPVHPHDLRFEVG